MPKHAVDESQVPAVIQLAFDMSLNPVYRWENFYISESNEDAISLLQRWPNWDHRVQLIYGPKASGKTHMAHLWRHESRASFVDDSVLKLDYLEEYVEQNPFLIIDDADLVQSHEGLLHLFNLVIEHQGYLLLTAASPPSTWTITLPDLMSRLQSIPKVHIQAPDDALMKAILIKRFSDLQLKVSENVLSYLMKHIHRSYESIHATTKVLSEKSLELRRNLTLPLVKSVLSL